jgi:hypothetical protein
MDAEQRREKAKEVQVQQIQIDIEKSKPTVVKVPVLTTSKVAAAVVEEDKTTAVTSVWSA